MKLAKLPSHGMVPGFSGRSKSGASGLLTEVPKPVSPQSDRRALLSAQPMTPGEIDYVVDQLKSRTG
jgi:hypothetical protein